MITAKINNAIRLVHLDEAAEALGLETGMSLTDARAAHPHIDAVEQHSDADHALIEALAGWADRYTPLVAVDRTDENIFGLTLDITGCAHLFGGEKAMMADLLSRLFHQGFAASAAIAPTPGGAWALARFRGQTAHHHSHAQDRRQGLTVVGDLQDLEILLAPLPIAALRLPGDLVSGLARLGLRTIGQLKMRPRGPLARRFGRQLLYRLDQALGAVEEAISPRLPVPDLMAERRFAEPLVMEDDLLAVTRRLAGHVCEDMERRGKGARKLTLSLFRVDGKVERIEVGTARAMRDPDRILSLFRERFAALQEDYDPGFGFETIRLAVPLAEPLEATQQDMTGGNDEGADHLIDRLAARLGSDAISICGIADTHLPEAAEDRLDDRSLAKPADTRVAQHDGLSVKAADDASLNRPLMKGLTRPLRVFTDPEPVEAMAEVPEGPPVTFRWRKVLHRVTRAEGPERIADSWWGRDVPRRTRDYYRIEDSEGRRYWLFREGLYGRETDNPRWFLHGLFA